MICSPPSLHRAARRALVALMPIAIAVAASASETVAYSYDAKGRLTATAHGGSVNSGVGSNYTFDHADNRSAHSITGGASVTVADASFESPSMGGWYAYRPAAAGVTFSGGAGLTGNNSAWGFTAPDGVQVAMIQTSGVGAAVSMDVSGLAPGASYVVRFKRQARPGFAPNSISVSFGGATLGTFSAGTSFQTATSAPFQATATTGTVTFTGEVDTAYDRTTGIDAIEIIRTS